MSRTAYHAGLSSLFDELEVFTGQAELDMSEETERILTGIKNRLYDFPDQSLNWSDQDALRGARGDVNALLDKIRDHREEAATA